MSVREASLLALYVEQARLAAERRRLSHDEVAQLSGVNPRTVERLFEGETCGEGTLKKVCVALGVQLDPVALIEARVLARVRQRSGQDRTRTAKNGQERTRAVGPIYGWREAAERLRMTSRSLRRYRRAAGDTTEVPWWEDEAALQAWFRGLTAAIASTPRAGAPTAPAAPTPIR